MTEERKRANAEFHRAWATGKGRDRIKLALNSYWQEMTGGQKAYAFVLVKNGWDTVNAIHHAYMFGCPDGEDIVDKLIKQTGGKK